MGLYRSVSGSVRIELTSADIPSCLETVVGRGIPIYALEHVDEVTVRFSVRRKDSGKLNALLSKRGETAVLRKRAGLYWYLHALRLRPVILVVLPALLLFGLFLSGRILFIEVEGNQSVPERLILEAAAESGISFGASRREFRSERMKNALLGALPQLQWAGVNTYGCRAVISVRERATPPEEKREHAVTSIVATMDGIVTSCTVTQGTALCVPGQAVKAGQRLISGYTDCGITVEATRAMGEITALTRRELTVKIPSQLLQATQHGNVKEKFSLILGKKRINFYKGSGISGSSCVKMYTEYVLTLPGGFALPVTLVKETFAERQVAVSPIPDPSSHMEAFAEGYLNSRMVCGVIHQKTESVEETGGAYCLTGIYACTEMIGAEQDEKIGDFNGKTDGTDRQRGSGG